MEAERVCYFLFHSEDTHNKNSKVNLWIMFGEQLLEGGLGLEYVRFREKVSQDW